MQPRNKKIWICGGIFILLTVVLFFISYNMLVPKKCEGDNCFLIYGNVKEEYSLQIEDLYDRTYSRVENKDSFFLNSYGTEYTRKLSGVVLYDILANNDILNDNATHIQFMASDGYLSPPLPLTIVEESPEDILLLTHEGGNVIRSKDQGGDGPIKSYVSLSVLEESKEIQLYYKNQLGTHVYNTLFYVKWVTAVLII